MTTENRVLQGKYVTLRPLRESDAEQTLRWRQSDRAAYLNAGAATVEDQRRWIAGRPASEYNFIIELNEPKGDVKCVGMLSLIGISKQHSHAESARFLIGEEEAVKGVPAAVEAMKLLYDLAFDELKLRRIHGTVSAGNKGMLKWQTYLGMKEEGRLRSHYFFQNEHQDAVCLGLLSEEYRTITLPRMRILMMSPGGNQ